MSNFKKFFPTGGRQLLNGGLNSKYAPSIIANNESPDCLNVVFDGGTVGTRLGTAKLNTTSVGSFVCDGIYSRRANDNSETMIVFFGGLAYALTGATTFTTIASAQSVFTQGVRVASVQDENYIFFCNGNTIPYKWNGTEWTRHSPYAPTVTATVASNGVGNLVGSATYMYKITAVNSNLVESNVGPASTFVISATSGQNTLSNIQTFAASYGISSRNIYRTSANGSTFYRLASLSDNTTTTYNDNIADSGLGAVAPTDNGVAPNYSTITYALGRLFCNDTTQKNFLWYSDVGNPYKFASTNFLRIGDNTSDLIRGLAYLNNSIVVFCDNSIWLVYLTSNTPSEWVTIKINSAYGSRSPFAPVVYNNKLLFPAVQNQKFVGFGALVDNAVDTNRTLLTVTTTGSDLKTDKIETDMYQVQESFMSNISAIVYKKKAWIAVTYGTSQTTNNRVYQMDFSMSYADPNQEFSWCPFTGINAAQFVVYNGGLYYGSSTANGRVYKAEQTAFNDDGAAINSYIRTKEYVGDEDPQGSDTNLVKDFRYINTLVEALGQYYMNLSYRNDSDRGDGTSQQISLNPGGSFWGSMIWGVDSWGGGVNQMEVRTFLRNSRGKRIQFKFDNQNTVNQGFKVHGFNFIYNLKGYR